MKKLIITGCLVLAGLLLNAQSWNPYVNQGMFELAPILPMEFEGEGEISFNIGNTGSSEIFGNNIFQGNNSFNLGNNINTNRREGIVLTIKMYNGIPNMNNPLAALGGTWKGKFNWTYNESSNTFKGVQKNKIKAYSQGTLTIGYKVSTNTPINGPVNGFEVEMKVPDYMAGINHSADDKVSSFTFTRAYDQGDAPESYGAAMHEINLIKDTNTGTYSKYVYLGNRVDQEPFALASFGAIGDDNDNLNDEDGVIFPELIAGTTVTIPITVTTEGNSWGILNAWFDWNGDGDFMDAGEKVNEAPIPVFSSDTIDLSVTIPENAAEGKNTYARFRIGGNSGPTSINAWGEVEDYKINILRSSPIVVDIKTNDVSVFGGSDGAISLTVSGGTQPYQYLWDNGINKKDIENLKAGDYGVTIRDANNITVNHVISVYEPSDSWENEVVLSGQEENRDVVLIWQTPKEKNTSQFRIERSIDGSEFEQIGINIKAAGNTENLSNYSFTDNEIDGEMVSYRIILKETNNKEVVSNMITKILDDYSPLKVELYPNPVGEVYRVTINKRGSYLLELMDMSGRMISTTTMDVKDNTGEKTMYRNGIMSGQYILRVTDKSNRKTRALKVLMSE